MKIIKSPHVSLLSRTYRQHQQENLSLAVIVLAAIGELPKLYPERDLWTAVEQYLPGRTLDLALPKRCAEYLLAGQAWGHYCDSDQRCEVAVQIAEHTKQLTVSGDRHWQAGRPSAASTFDSMPLDWAHSYGGPKLAENPLGKGMLAQAGEQGDWSIPVPNIEYPQAALQRAGQKGIPAGWLALPPQHPIRLGQFGHPDKKWLDQDFPGFPADMDEGYFNIAPLDQRWAGHDHIATPVRYRLTHLHPRYPIQVGEVPAIAARAFLGRRQQSSLEECRLRLTTLCFFPGIERIAMIYHGAAAVECFDAVDIETLVLAVELSAAPRSAAYYQSVYEQQQDRSHPHRFDDDALAPSAILVKPTPVEPTLQRGDLRQQHQTRSAQLAQQQADQRFDQHFGSQSRWPHQASHDLPAATETIKPEALPEHAKTMAASAEQQTSLLERDKQRLLHDSQPHLADPEGLDQALHGSRSGPPTTPSIPANLLTRAPAGMAVDELQAQARQAGPALLQAYRHGAQYQPALGSQPDESRRRAVEAAYHAGESLAGWDLTGLDLSGIDLHGANLSGALLESANLADACLDRCDLSQAVLVRSQMRHSSLREVQLTGANMAQSEAHDCDFSGARLDGTVLDQVHWQQVNLGGASLDRCSLVGAELKALDLGKASLRQLVFNQLQLAEQQCQHATVRKVAFVQCQLSAMDFSHADIESLAVVECTLDHGTRFTHASIRKTCFVGGCKLDDLDLSGAILNETNWRAAHAPGISLADAHIRASDFTDACLRQGNFSHARFDQVQLIRVDFSGANLQASDLIGAYLRGARLNGANLQRANLFRANLGEVSLDHHTQLQDAYLERIAPYPTKPANGGQGL